MPGINFRDIYLQLSGSSAWEWRTVMKKIEFIDNYGGFMLENPELLSYLYFPIAGEAGVMSSITPELGGDSKTSQNTFLLEPVTCESLHNNKSTRNFWVKLDGGEYWSAAGVSAKQQADKFTKDKEKTSLEAGLLYQTVRRKSARLQLESEITSFVPYKGAQSELTKIVIKNCADKPRSIQGICAVPIYGRSADNIRDHRNVTSMLNRIYTMGYGVAVNPTLTFDERGHKINNVVYGVFASCGGKRPSGFYPTVDNFIGEGGSFENPRAVVEGLMKAMPSGQEIDGYEAMGGLEFAAVTVAAGESLVFIQALSYGDGTVGELEAEAAKLLSEKAFDELLDDTRKHWRGINHIGYKSADDYFDRWIYWVNFQPVLRRIYGCSFLPHHDYGKGGRGWRDLWQDCLALLLMNPDGVREMLRNNFCGVRIDGTNATIIGKKQGEFIADRNGIARVWMDHGVWPFITTKLYLDETGDYGFLFEEIPYFKDKIICRGEAVDELWNEQQGCSQMDALAREYKGTVLEHILVELLTSFYDVGEHNHIRIRGADWNDALDMAKERGESVAFTMMYGRNMCQLCEVLSAAKELLGIEKVSILKEISMLLGDKDWCYDNVSAKQSLLKKYSDMCSHEVSGEKEEIAIDKLIENLSGKADWITENVQRQEWLSEDSTTGWFNGYYDNDGQQLERAAANGDSQIMLTSQVFAIMSGVASDEQTKSIIKAADKYLYEPSAGGYRLNTDFHEVKLNMGRMFGFAYGQKENGAVFSHMAVMYAKALYERGFIKEGYKVINSLYSHAGDIEHSRIYPGIPEYFMPNGRGVYHYLTGAASWLLLTVLTEMYGIKGLNGNLMLSPKLLAEQFDSEGKASVKCKFAGRSITVTYINKDKREYGSYSIKKVSINGKEYSNMKNSAISRKEILSLDENADNEILVELG